MTLRLLPAIAAEAKNRRIDPERLHNLGADWVHSMQDTLTKV